MLDKQYLLWYNIDVVERLDCEPPKNIVLSMTIKGSNEKNKRVATE